MKLYFLQKEWARRGLQILALVAVFNSAEAQAATWYAASGAAGSGTTSADPGDLEDVVETLSASGDTVILAAGTYVVSSSGVEVSQPLFIRGAGMGSTVLDCTAAPYCMDLDSTAMTKSNTIVSDLTFQDGMYYQVNLENGSPMIKRVGFTGTISVASFISRSGHPVILQSSFTADDTGFYAHDGSEPELIAGCTFSSSASYGISLTSAASGEITRNTFQGGYAGIFLYAAPTIYGGTNSAVSIHHNTFSANGWGIYMRAVSGATGENTISQNRFMKNTYGIVSDADSTSTEVSFIDSNRFDGQSGYALYMEDTAHDVVNNLFTSNSVDAIVSVSGANNVAFNTIANNVEDGISLETSDASIVVNNISFSNGLYGIAVDASSAGVELGGNDNFANTSGAISGAYVNLGGNVSVNPRFVSATNYDLRPTSPLIDAAITTYSIGYDITGAARATPDIGAYEF